MIKSNIKISLKNINLEINENKLFENLSSEILGSGISVILGPNGSGKTMLLKIINGIIKPNSGKINLKKRNNKLSISYASQKIIMLRRNVYENLRFALSIKRLEKKIIHQRILYLLKFFELEDKINFSARKLSAGKKQYLSIIRALSLDSDIILLDEPCSNLDHRSTRKIEEFIINEKKRGKKLIIVTHDIFQAKRLADEIIFLRNGKIISQTSKKNFFLSNNSMVKKFVEGKLI